MKKNYLMIVGVYLLICIVTSVIENLVLSILSVNDYKNECVKANVLYSTWSMIGIFFIIFGRLFVWEVKDKNFHDWIGLVSLFILWPVHLIGWIICVSVPKLRKIAIDEYKELYEGFDNDYFKLKS